MEIVRVVLLVAVSTAVAALMLYVFGGWPKALPYGEPMPYITFKNTTRGIQLGVFDYSNAPVTAHIYVNGRYAGSGRGWTDVYVKCGDYVEALFQYNGFARKVEGGVSCSTPIMKLQGGQFVYMSRNSIESMVALGVEVPITITAECYFLLRDGYYVGYYPVFYIRIDPKAVFAEYKVDSLRYTGRFITIDPETTNVYIPGVLRLSVYPPYGYSTTDYIGSREFPLAFRVYELGDPFITKGYVIVDGNQYEVAYCRATISTYQEVKTYNYTMVSQEVNRKEPNAIYEVFVKKPDGSVYRVSFIFYPGDVLSVVSSKVGNIEVSGNSITIGQYQVYGDANLGTALALADNILRKRGTSLGNVITEVVESGDFVDKTYGSLYTVTVTTNTYTKKMIVSHVDAFVRWYSHPYFKIFKVYTISGIFRGLSNGGWDLFLTRYGLEKIVVNSTLPVLVT